jgi:hypothetical protein
MYMWTIPGIFDTCQHAIKFLRTLLHLNPVNYCGHMYTVQHVKQMYTGDPGQTSVATTIDVLHNIGWQNIDPPSKEVQRGRKHTKRIESQSVNHKKKAKRAVVCPLCKMLGHYKKNCQYNGVGAVPDHHSTGHFDSYNPASTTVYSGPLRGHSYNPAEMTQFLQSCISGPTILLLTSVTYVTYINFLWTRTL